MRLASTALAQNVTPKPIPAFTWSMEELGKDIPWMASPYPNLTMLYRLYKEDAKNPAIVKKLTDQQPDGRRAILDWDLYRCIYSSPEDKFETKKGEKFTGLWWDAGVVDAEKAYDEFFKAYKKLGGKLDYLVIDSEHGPETEVTSPERWAVVEKDPRFAETLKAVHLKSAADIYNAKPLSYAFWRYSDYLACRNYNHLYAVVKKYYPDVKFSDYSVCHHKPATLFGWGIVPDMGDIPGRTGCHVGTHQSPSLYGVITYLGAAEVDGKPYGLGPFRSAMYATNILKEAMLAAKDVPLMPYIAWRGYVSDWEKLPEEKRPPYSSIGKTDYFQEVAFHAAMCSPDAILVWNSIRWNAQQDPADYCQKEDMVQLDEMMGQINKLVGYRDRVTLVTAETPAHQPFILSGCKANGRSVWRLTPDPDQSAVELAKIKINDDPLTFKLNSCILSMPAAKIYTPEKNLSSVGYWIVGPANLKPIITRGQ